MTKNILAQIDENVQIDPTLTLAQQREAILTAPEGTWQLVLEAYLPGADPILWQRLRANYDPKKEKQRAKKRAARRKRNTAARRRNRNRTSNRNRSASDVLHGAIAELVERVNTPAEVAQC